MPDEPNAIDPNAIKIQRADDYRLIYANNVVSDATAWDVRLTFGQFDKLTDGALVNIQQLSVTITYELAKYMMFWLELQVIAHEIEMGRRVGLRPSVIPNEVPPVAEEDKNNPNIVKLHDEMTKLRAK